MRARLDFMSGSRSMIFLCNLSRFWFPVRSSTMMEGSTRFGPRPNVGNMLQANLRGAHTPWLKGKLCMYIYIYTKLLLEMYQVNPKIDRNHFQYSFSGHLLFYLFGA